MHTPNLAMLDVLEQSQNMDKMTSKYMNNRHIMLLRTAERKCGRLTCQHLPTLLVL